MPMLVLVPVVVRFRVSKGELVSGRAVVLLMSGWG